MHKLHALPALAVSGIAAPDDGLPEAANHLLAGDVAPAVLDIALIGDFVHNDRFFVANAPICNPLGGLIEVNTLNAAMGNPRSRVVIMGVQL